MRPTSMGGGEPWRRPRPSHGPGSNPGREGPTPVIAGTPYLAPRKWAITSRSIPLRQDSTSTSRALPSENPITP